MQEADSRRAICSCWCESAARPADGAAAIGQPPKRGCSRMAQPMNDEIVPRLSVPGRARLSEPAAATLLEALGLRRGAVEAALAGDMLAMKLYLEPVLPRCHERPVTFSLSPLVAIDKDEPSPREMSRAMMFGRRLARSKDSPRCHV
jgi:hypothetical protein